MMIQWIFAAAALCFTHYVTYAAGTQGGGLRQPRRSRAAIGKTARERMEMMAIPRRSNRYRNVWNERTEDCLNKEGTRGH